MESCYFKDTYDDLQICYSQMDEYPGILGQDTYRRRLIILCIEIALEYGEDVDRHIIEAID